MGTLNTFIFAELVIILAYGVWPLSSKKNIPFSVTNLIILRIFVVSTKKMDLKDYHQEAVRLTPLLRQRAMRYLHDEAESEDAVQVVLMRLWQMADSLRAPVDALAMTLLRNHCVDLLRRRKRTLTPEETERKFASLGTAPPDDEREQERRISMMLALMEKLPAQQQTVLQLRHINGMEMAEVAQVMGMSEVAVRKCLSRGRQALRALMLKRMVNE